MRDNLKKASLTSNQKVWNKYKQFRNESNNAIKGERYKTNY